MFIDSPLFPKRKVVNSNSSAVLGFGEERVKLANFVTDQLNLQHQNDAAVLDKFRKQAEQYKRNLLRRNHVKPVIQHQVYQTKNNNGKNIASLNHLSRVPTVQSEDSDSSSDSEVQREKQRKDSFVRQIARQQEQKNQELLKIIGKKDRQIQKQSITIKKTQKNINQLKRRLQKLQRNMQDRQNQRIAQIQRNNFNKIRGYISEMSAKINQNSSILKQQLVKKRQIPKIPVVVEEIKPKKQTQYTETPQKWVKASSQSYVNPQSAIQQYQQASPSISYSNYKMKSFPEMQHQLHGLKHKIQNLKYSKNRLDALGSFSSA